MRNHQGRRDRRDHQALAVMARDRKVCGRPIPGGAVRLDHRKARIALGERQKMVVARTHLVRRNDPTESDAGIRNRR